MRPISTFVHAFAAASIATLAASSAAAVNAFIVFFDKADGESIARGRQVEIHSFHWGPRQSTSAIELEPVKVTSYQLGGSGASSGGGVNEIRMDDTAGREKLQPGGGGGGAGQKDMVLKGKTISQNSALPPELPVMSSITESSASGQATGKRQHKPFVMRGYYDTSTPPARGSLTVLASGGSCRVGARYPSLQLSGGGKTYVLQGVTVTSCGGSSAAAGDGLLTEEISFAYQTIKFTY